ncbi:MAG: type II toxin-antitoxin system RelE/ParE family toxin [Nostoc sp. DedQUE05]|uniref:type II toxin-antitoxin system RelE family toxin n=1 Tax=Nostoc sp. DedQUE05 TaxID=3075391 RepID=UPI002AD3FF59|nr:type II toxin-antitoxin system RelE/ParE family toxin [Nostoc sp. DedQUE05]MDZ8092101.1 type II toxin-antitoxin system RelE/ParE family toxin [Nostoc sp. DedQUE05]
MNQYKIEFSNTAFKQFKKLPIKVRTRIQTKIDELADNPRPNGVVKLEDSDNGYRIRVGSYRVIYDIFDDVLIVSVVKVGHRKEVYRNE